MDYQNRPGGSTGSGGVLSKEETNVSRRERLRQLALETIDLNKDPYFMRNHLGQYECKLCLTIHLNEGSYLAHTQAKKHQTNLARRAAKDAKEQAAMPQPAKLSQNRSKKKTVKIGRPGYKITKIKDRGTQQLGLLFQIKYPEIVHDLQPRYRFMSAYEQKMETADKNFQYLLVAAEPYETISFKLDNREIDVNHPLLLSYWDPDLHEYSLQFFYKPKRTNFSKHGHADIVLNPLNPLQAPAVPKPTFMTY